MESCDQAMSFHRLFVYWNTNKILFWHFARYSLGTLQHTKINKYQQKTKNDKRPSKEENKKSEKKVCQYSDHHIHHANMHCTYTHTPKMDILWCRAWNQYEFLHYLCRCILTIKYVEACVLVGTNKRPTKYVNSRFRQSNHTSRKKKH